MKLHQISQIANRGFNYRPALEDAHNHYTTLLPLSPKSMKRANSQETGQSGACRQSPRLDRGSGLPVLRSKPGRDTGSHRISTRGRSLEIHLRQKDIGGNSS